MTVVLSEPCAWHRLALFNGNIPMMLWWLMKGCMAQSSRNAAVWIAEIVRVKKVEISLATLFWFS